MSILKNSWSHHLKGHPSRIVVHWTAGGYKASHIDKEHYHFIIEHPARVVLGDHKVQDNDSTRDGHYAAHVGGMNTGSIGVSLCCMAGAREHNFGAEPLQKDQWDMMIELVAELCRHYDIPVTQATVLTHAEVPRVHGISQGGKWDIATLPFDPVHRSVNSGSAERIGNLMRESVLGLLDGHSETLPRVSVHIDHHRIDGVLSNSSTYADVKSVFQALGWPDPTFDRFMDGEPFTRLPSGEAVWLMWVDQKFFISVRDVAKLTGGRVDWDGGNKIAKLSVPALVDH